MKDRMGREIDYMRFSITDRCNLRCKYCMPICERQMPENTGFGGRHEAACWLHHEMAPKVAGINDFEETAGKEV